MQHKPSKDSTTTHSQTAGYSEIPKLSKISRYRQAIATTGIASVVCLASVASAATLEEVVVVAQKRAQPLQDVPVSVAAVDAERISDAGIVDLQGLSDFVPNFSINETGISTTIAVRGISSGINSGFEQSVGMYNDGIFYGRDQLARVPMFDMERVEILRGPQGILYGKNSIAGAVSQITAKPTDTFEGSITALYEGQHDEQDWRLVLSGPLNEVLSGRLAILDRTMDGYMLNTTSGEEEQREEEQVIRASLQWDINENTTANLKTSRATFDTLGRNLEVFNSIGDPKHLDVLNTLVDGFIFDNSGNVVGINPENYIEGELDYNNSNNGHNSNNRVDNATLTIDWEMDGLTVTSVTGVVDYEFDELCDCDFTGAEIFNATRDEKYNQLSQELRFTSELGNTIDYIGGIFYQSTDLEYGDSISLTDPTVIETALNLKGADSLAPLAPGASTEREFNQKGNLWAVFAQATWNLAEGMRLTLGGRYTNEGKDANRMQQHIASRTYGGQPLPGKAPEGASPQLAGLINGYNNLFGIFGIEPYDTIVGEIDDSSFTPLVSMQWDVDEETMLYATWTKGYKSGGFDARSNAHWDGSVGNAINPLVYSAVYAAVLGTQTSPEAQAAAAAAAADRAAITGSWIFDREESNSFELGSKMLLADGAAELNLALYYTEYKDLQVSQFDGVLGFNVTNAGEATVQGLEADGRWAVSDNVILTGSLAYLDFNYDKFPNSQCYFGQTSNSQSHPGLCDVNGQRKEYTPEFQANIGAAWSDQLSNGLYLDAGIDLLYMDDYLYASNLDPQAEQDAFVLVNARLSLANSNDTWEVALIGRNLTDETVINFGGNTPLAGVLTDDGGNSYYGFVNRPRNVALQAVYRF
jgi:iron complex outermembrane receptor protein